MNSKLSKPLMLAVLATSLALSASLPSQAATSAVPVEEFSVFVDLPTGFAFVKTPAGWHFVRQIEASRLGELHPSTLMSVMQAGERIGSSAEARAAQVL